jgi:hypothetical protein
VDDRSTTLSAWLSDQQRGIRLLEVDLRGLTGSPLVGRRVRLDFDTKLAFVGDESYAKTHPVFDLWGEVTVSRDRTAPPRSLGRLRLKEPAFVMPSTPEAGPWMRRLELRLELNQRQLDEIEELRAGGGLVFSINLDGLGHLSGGVGRLTPSNNFLYYEASQSDWIRLLDQVQYGRYVAIEVALPQPGELGGDLAIAAKSLEEAIEALRRGADEEAVADCRDALEALIRDAGGKPQSPIGDHGLTKDERFTYVQYAAHRVTHLAHHPNDPTASGGVGSVSWDRADAQAVIAMLAALIRRAART